MNSARKRELARLTNTLNVPHILRPVNGFDGDAGFQNDFTNFVGHNVLEWLCYNHRQKATL